MLCTVVISEASKPIPPPTTTTTTTTAAAAATATATSDSAAAPTTAPTTTPTPTATYGDWLVPRFEQLLKTLSGNATTTAGVWEVVARFHTAMSSRGQPSASKEADAKAAPASGAGAGAVSAEAAARVIASREKQCQLLMTGGWLSDAKKFEDAVKGVRHSLSFCVYFLSDSDGVVLCRWRR
jgi:hypothetical protein